MPVRRFATPAALRTGLTSALPLDKDETQVLLNVLNGSVVEPAFIEYLAQEIRDSDDYLEGIPAAKSLYEKCQSATYPQLLATVERLNR
ncbi:hypothetical protein ACK3XA_23175 [Klebsiella grimontii]|uniref:hypothetical protein n=1 Tax=Klebsiella grimontii TaxID=2058152 RepID=UPI00391D6433